MLCKTRFKCSRDYSVCKIKQLCFNFPFVLFVYRCINSPPVTSALGCPNGPVASSASLRPFSSATEIRRSSLHANFLLLFLKRRRGGSTERPRGTARDRPADAAGTQALSGRKTSFRHQGTPGYFLSLL